MLPVQFKATYGAAALASIAIVPTAMSAGNLIAVGVRWITGGFTCTGVNDTAGNTYVRRYSFPFSTATMELWEAENSIAHASNVITASFSGAATNRSIVVGEFSGVALTDAFNFASPSGTSNTSVIANVTLNLKNNLIINIAQWATSGSVFTPSAGFTLGVADSNNTQAMMYAIGTGVATINTPSVTVGSGSVNKSLIVSEFLPPSSTGAITVAQGYIG